MKNSAFIWCWPIYNCLSNSDWCRKSRFTPDLKQMCWLDYRFKSHIKSTVWYFNITDCIRVNTDERHLRSDYANNDVENKNISLQWRHDECDGVSNHQPHDCLLNRLIRRGWKKTSKLRVTGLCEGKSPGTVNSQHKGPVTRKMFPFGDVTMCIHSLFSH